MRKLTTWSGKATFEYTGSIASGIHINFGREGKNKATLSEQQCQALLNEFKGRTISMGSSRDKVISGSIGEWLNVNVTKTAIASYICPILVAEGYASFITLDSSKGLCVIKFN